METVSGNPPVPASPAGKTRGWLRLLAPALVYLAGELAFGTRAALALFAGTSGLQLVIVLLWKKRLDRPLLAETALGGAAAVVLLLIGEDSPAHVGELVFALLVCGTLLAPVLLGPAALNQTLARLRPELAANPAVTTALRRIFLEGAIVAGLAALLLLGDGLVPANDTFTQIAPWIMPVALGGWLLVRLGGGLLRRRREEIFPIIDATGRVIGQGPRTLLHRRPDLLHPVVHLHIVDDQGRLLLQRRAGHKDSYPGYWDVSVGGHVRYGETPDAALFREAREECGHRLVQARFLFTAVYRYAAESELAYVHLTRAAGPFFPADGEAEELRFFSPAEIRHLLATAPCTPCLHAEFPRLLDMGALSG